MAFCDLHRLANNFQPFLLQDCWGHGIHFRRGFSISTNGSYVHFSFDLQRFSCVFVSDAHSFRPISFFRDLNKIVYGLSTALICLGWPRGHHNKIRLEILHIQASEACQTTLRVQLYDHVNPYQHNVAVKTIRI